MAKNKHKRFAENKTFPHLFQPTPQQMYEGDFHLKGKWNSDFFKNDNPIIIEVGCGKGEYTIGLARKHKDINYIGIDIKGARLWKGSKTAQEEDLKNVAFIRNKIEFLCSLFADNEISEIWITFPDPQKRKIKKRLTSARFLEVYAHILSSEGKVHLKTDSVLMHEFTNEIIKLNNLDLIYTTDNLYSTDIDNELTRIKTYYEQKFLDQGMNITYLKFAFNHQPPFDNPEEEQTKA